MRKKTFERPYSYTTLEVLAAMTINNTVICDGTKFILVVRSHVKNFHKTPCILDK
jgi:hypothetical protein